MKVGLKAYVATNFKVNSMRMQGEFRAHSKRRDLTKNLTKSYKKANLWWI